MNKKGLPRRIQAGEDITLGAEREVLEETGIRARFSAVLAMRQAHGFAFGKSDLFFVLALTPEPGEQKLVMQEDVRRKRRLAGLPASRSALQPAQARCLLLPLLRRSWWGLSGCRWKSFCPTLS